VLTNITLDPPQRSGQTVTLRWHVEPATPLYHASQASLRFPDGVDLSRVPEAVWWMIAIGCLQPHWPLLRPCRVHLPVHLPPGAVELWLRLMDAEVATLESLRNGNRFGREVEIVETGPPLTTARVPESPRCAIAFSGGKDSLVHAGLLTELTDRPVLVTTTSPMHGTHDHATARRRHVMQEIARRREVTHVEVASDFRSCWDNGFPWRLDYAVAVNELTDTYLYWGALLAVGVALGAPHLFLASETEVQENEVRNGRTVQHPHFMYSTITQRALQALGRDAGLRYCSLTSPLQSSQVQALLWTRYRDLRDLQYSCWQVKPDEAACSRCPQCLRMAMYALAIGDDPVHLGVDLGRVLWAQRRWRGASQPEDDGHPIHPRHAVSRMLASQTIRSVQATSLARVARVLVGGQPARLVDRRSWLGLAAYAQLRHRFASERVGPAPGFRAGFLDLVDPLVRDGVARIYAEHFKLAPPGDYAAVLDRNHELSRFIAEPVGGE